jgi:AP-4 complex subunit sigma-1
MDNVTDSLHPLLTQPITTITNSNKQGQTRLSSYYEWIPVAEKAALESEIVRKCLSRSELQCSFLEYRGYKVVYRRYASLFFIVGTKPSPDEEENPENELGLLEFIHTLVETMDKWAGSICELDIMYQLEQVHFLLDEMVMNGNVVETNKNNILRPLDLMERESKKADSMYR